MKMRCFLINRDNVRTFRLLQGRFQADLDSLFYMGKMNLLHIAADAGWSELARELLAAPHSMAPDLRCPSVHMRPAGLTPLMLAAGAGHLEVRPLVGCQPLVSTFVQVVTVLLEQPGLDTELKDSYGMTALFHTCNHGHHRVGDQHGYFRRLWSWDLSPAQLEAMEALGRTSALPILRCLVQHGAALHQRDNTGAGLLTRAASVDRFQPVLEFLIEVSWLPAAGPE
jgi:hypothetical protein